MATSKYRWVVLAIAFLVQVFCSLSLSLLSPLGPFICDDLNMSNAQFGLLFTAANLGTMLMLSYTGKLVDKLGVKTIMLVGQTIMGVALLFGSLSQATWHLFVALFVTGLCQSIAGPTGVKMIMSWFDSRSRATAMGIKQAGIPSAGILAGIALPPLSLLFGWRCAFGVIGVVVIASGISSFVLYRTPCTVKESSDRLRNGKRVWNKEKQAARSAALASKNLAELRQHKADRKKRGQQRRAYSRDIMLISIGCGVLMGVQFVFTSYLVTYLGDIFTESGMDSPFVHASLLLSVCSLGGFIGRVVLGIISDRLLGGRRKELLIAVNVVAVVALVALAFLVPHVGMAGAAIIVFTFGLTGVSFTGLQLAMVSEMAGPDVAGSASGFTLAFGFAGMMALPPAFGAVVDKCDSYISGWLLLAAIAIVGILLLFPVKERRANMPSKVRQD